MSASPRSRAVAERATADAFQDTEGGHQRWLARRFEQIVAEALAANVQPEFVDAWVLGALTSHCPGAAETFARLHRGRSIELDLEDFPPPLPDTVPAPADYEAQCEALGVPPESRGRSVVQALCERIGGGK